MSRFPSGMNQAHWLQSKEFEGAGLSDLQLRGVASVLIRGQAFLRVLAQSDKDNLLMMASGEDMNWCITDALFSTA